MIFNEKSYFCAAFQAHGVSKFAASEATRKPEILQIRPHSSTDRTEVS